MLLYITRLSQIQMVFYRIEKNTDRDMKPRIISIYIKTETVIYNVKYPIRFFIEPIGNALYILIAQMSMEYPISNPDSQDSDTRVRGDKMIPNINNDEVM